jgi:cation-dependent mannose-6-phosphate receptor
MAKCHHPCTLTLHDGTHYDLSSLSSATSDYAAIVGDREYKMNVCRAVVGELYKVDEPELVGAYTSRERGDFSLGYVTQNCQSG